MRTFFLVLFGLIFFLAVRVVLPPLFNRPIASGFIIFLIAVILTLGLSRRAIGWGLAVSFIAELASGAYFGEIMTAWLVVALLWHILIRYLSLRDFSESGSPFPLIYLSIAGLLMFVVAEAVQWLVIKFLYDRSLSFSFVRQMIFSPTILGSALIELIVLMLLIKVFCPQPKSIYG